MKKRWILCIVTILAAGLLICAGLFIHAEWIGHKISDGVYGYLEEFPEQKAPYVYTEVYAEYEGTEYLLLQYHGQQLIGQRDPNGETVYYLNGSKWKIGTDNEQTPIDAKQQTSEADIVAVVRYYADGEKSPGSCTRATGGALPFWVARGEYYLQYDRQDHLHEVMALREEDTNSCLRWYILDTEDPEVTPSAKLFMHTCCTENDKKWFSQPELWGEIPQELENTLFR